MSVHRTLLVLAQALVCTTTLHAQGLGAVVTRADEERRTSERSAVRISGDDLPQQSEIEAALTSFRFTTTSLEFYAQARRCVLEQRVTSAPLDAALQREEIAEGDPLTTEAILAGNRELLACLDAVRLTPRAYTLADLAFRRALDDSAHSDSDVAQLPATRGANARFIRANNYRVTNALSSFAEQESKIRERRSWRR